MEVQPQLVDSPPSPTSICSQGPRQVLIETFIQQHIRNHFSGSRVVEAPSIRSYKWRNTVAASDLLIELLDVWTPEAAGQRPAVLIRANDESSQRISIGDAHHSPGDLTAFGRYSDLVLGSVTVFCLSTQGGEAGVLAGEVWRELKFFAPIIRAQLGLLRFVSTQKGRIMKVKEAKDHWGVPLTFAYGFEEIWTLRQQTPKITSIELST